MDAFVGPQSIVRRVWGDADLLLLVFAGAAAEFALNRAADWLFVTGALPRDPLGRLFATAASAQRIALGSRAEAARALAAIRAAHHAVERRRGGRIPDWAHRDVLYLLVDYSERAFAALPPPPHRARAGGAVRRLPARRRGARHPRAARRLRGVGGGPGAPHGARPGVHRAHGGALRGLPPRARPLAPRAAAARAGRARPRCACAPCSASRARPSSAGSSGSTPAVARLGLRPAVRRALVPPAQLDAVRRLDRVAEPP
jgi:hypothetical protein